MPVALPAVTAPIVTPLRVMVKAVVVILPFVESAAEVLNTRVTVTLALAATRSPAAMLNVAAVG